MTARRRIVVLGAGGQAREIRWAISEINSSRTEVFEFLGFVVSDLSILGARDSNELVLGDYRWLYENRRDFDALALGIGSPAARMKVADDLEREFGAEYWPPLVHPSAIFDKKSCKLAHGVYIGAGFVGTVNLRFDRHAMANFGCSIGHETVIGGCSVVNPGANVSGGVEVGARVLVGTGAQILQYLKVGDGAVIGAGAVVTKDVGAGETVVGVPAKVLRRG
jgi:sugar O-acyltransferase (sialic acid O-acetyltransferase NeuD family)